MEMSTALGNNRDRWRFKDGDGDFDENSHWKNISNARSGSSEGRLMKSKEINADSLADLMDVLSGARNNKTR